MRRVLTALLFAALCGLSTVGVGGPAAGAVAPVVVNVASGDNFSCAVTAAQGVDCWGDNSQGELGNGVTSSVGSPTPVAVFGLSNVIAVTAGGSELAGAGANQGQHACALTTNELVECWGDNSHGQLGNGSTTASSVPVPVRNLTDVVQISAGAFHTCAVTAERSAYCWGADTFGQLGDGNGSFADRSVPTSVFGLNGSASQVSAGFSHTCARLSSGSVECWGDNSSSALGAKSTIKNAEKPSVVQGLSAVSQVVAGDHDSCAVLSSGIVKCWGLNTSGQLGNGTVGDDVPPKPVVRLNGVAQVSLGSIHTCARTRAGAVWCWGANGSAGVGDGKSDGPQHPVPVVGLDRGVTVVTAGGNVSCAEQPGQSSSLLAGASIVCWGQNKSGGVGNGTAGDANVPAAVRVGPLQQLSHDPLQDTVTQHQTQAQPDSLGAGSTIVTAFESGLSSTLPGGSEIRLATSSDGGATWVSQPLAVTKPDGGTFDGASDPSVAYDASRGKWLVATIGNMQSGGSIQSTSIVLSSSHDGIHQWTTAATSLPAGAGPTVLSHPRIGCEAHKAAGNHYGSCYITYVDSNHVIHAAASRDGGSTWTFARFKSTTGSVSDGKLVVQPNGHVVIVSLAPTVLGKTALESFVSTDGGANFTGPYDIGDASIHHVGASLNISGPPSAAVDKSGNIYVAWTACGFSPTSDCQTDWIWMSKSVDGKTWSCHDGSSCPRPIPTEQEIDLYTSHADYFLPGLAVDANTAASSAHLALTYYYYPEDNCGTGCDLDVGYVSSVDGGATWRSATQLAGPMQTSWLATGPDGRTVGDYVSTSFARAASHIRRSSSRRFRRAVQRRSTKPSTRPSARTGTERS